MERALCLPFDTTRQGRRNSNFTYIAFSHIFFFKKKQNTKQNLQGEQLYNCYLSKAIFGTLNFVCFFQQCVQI